MMSVTMRKAWERAQEIDHQLSAHDFKNHYVRVEHDDGSHFLFNWAFYKTEGNYHMVFTEHQGFHVFNKDEVKIEEMEVIYAGVPEENDEDLEDVSGVHKTV